MRVLLIAPYYDKNVPGESWSTFKWVEGISALHETTVLTTHKSGWLKEHSPSAAVKVVNWTDPALPGVLRRLEFELKPGYFLFYQRARRWLEKQTKLGINFDVIHQINPLALRYPSPARNLKTPFLLGPLAGSLPTPSGFRHECRDRQWYRKLRQLDRLRLRYDPLMRSTFENAAMVLGVAPYVRKVLSDIKIRRFEVMSETGVENVSRDGKFPRIDGGILRLLFVGRVIRTKGVIDAIRAISIARSRVAVRLDVVGDGDSMKECLDEVEKLGLTDIVCFHGRLSRADVETWYRRSDVFLFPSFREPSGNVVFEAMANGLPVVGAAAGGPAHVIDDTSGILVEPRDPVFFAAGLADAIVRLGRDRHLIDHFSSGAIQRISSYALWDTKIRRLNELYDEVLSKA